MAAPRLAGREACEHLDDEIARLYQTKPERGSVKAFCQRHGVDRHRVRLRALLMGVAHTTRKEPPWSQAELDLLEKHHWKVPTSVAAIFRQQGYRRTAASIANKRLRAGLRVTDGDDYSASALATLMGVDTKTVTRWIAKGWLEATLKGTARTADVHQVTRRAVCLFIRDSVSVVDIRKADKYWLVDLLTTTDLPYRNGRASQRSAAHAAEC